MSRCRVLAGVIVLATACQSPPPPPPKSTEPAKGLPEIRKAKAGVENVQKATEQRTDQALDRAMQGEQVERGANTR